VRRDEHPGLGRYAGCGLPSVMTKLWLDAAV
jgi:hypothetical protein